ncbi:MAG: filamentous hemagglutinin N-terminal domain-containing protein, partial [Burkholderiales bacterium]
MVAVAEISAGRVRSPGTGASGGARIMPTPASGLTVIALGVAVACGATPGFALANPTGGVALVGQATMTSSGNNLLITTQNGVGASHSAIDWQSFSIPKGSSTYFQQPNAGSTSINRVVTNTPSQLFGTLGSNGNLVLVNQSGITVGAGAVVDTAGFTASSLHMTDADALAGRLRFGNASTPGGAVSVKGNVLARSGDVVLIGSNVSTGADSLVEAPNGALILGAGHAVSIGARGLEGINFEIQAPADSAVNLGTLKGDAVGIFAGTLKHSGLIRASQASLQGGKVVLKATGDAFVEGAGQILATGTVGGNVDVLGSRVAVTDQAVVDVSGEQGGGVVRIGGDYQGQNSSIQNASKTFFGPQASIQADATSAGAGGKVIVWADEVTRAYGHISAKGGFLTGDGGFVETSGKQFLDVSGIRVDAGSRAQNAASGVWLLDPPDIEIIAGSTTTANVTGAPNFVDVGTGASTLSATDLVSALSNGNVSVVATGALTVSTPIVAGSNGNLSLKATSGSLVVNQPITLTDKNLKLEASSGSIALGASLGVGTGEVNLKSGTTITQSAGAITASLLEVEAGGAVMLDQSNSVSTIAASVTGSGAAFSFKGASLINVNASSSISGVTTSGGAISIESTGGSVQISQPVNAGSGNVTLKSTADVTQSSTAQITGNVLTVTGGGNINLNQTANNAQTVVLTGAGTSVQVNYWDTDAFAVGPVTVAEALSLKSSGGAITQSGSITTGSGYSLTVEAGAGNVTLESTSNSLHGLTITSGGIVKVKDGGAVNLYSVAAGSFRLGAVGSVTLVSGGVSTSAGAVEISSSTSSISAAEGIQATGGAVTLKAANGLTVSSISGITSNVSGDAVLLIADTGTFSGTSPITTPNGRWLAYLKDPGGHTFPGVTSAPIFKQYNAPYGTSVLGTGNGVLYNNTATAKLTGSLTGSVTKVYDGGLSISLSGASSSPISGGYVDGDNGGTASLSGATGNLSDPNVGTAKSVSATGLLLSGISGGNSISTVYGYQTQFSGNIGAVTPAPVVVDVYPVSAALTGTASKTYDGTTAATLTPANFQLSGFVGSDSASVTKATGTYAGKNVGTGLTVTTTLAPTDFSPVGATLLSNYTLPTSASGNIGAISVAPLSVVANSANKTFGTTLALSGTAFTSTGLVAGETIGSVTLTSSGAVATASVVGGPYAIVPSAATGGTFALSNYAISYVNGALTVNPAALVAVAGSLSGSTTKVYDGTTTATLTPANYSLT